MAIIDVLPGSPTAIRDAVNAATQGDVIVVHDGIYHENVTIVKSNIRIIARNKHKAILDGENSRAQAFLLQDSAGVEIRGFTIKNYTTSGIASNLGGIITGGFHRIVNNSVQDILNGSGIVTGTDGNLLWKNTVKRAGGDGIEVFGRSNWIIRNVLHHNRQSGVAVTGLDTAIIQNKIFKNNIQAISSGTNFSRNTLVLGNEMFENGGSFLVSPSNWIIVGNDIQANKGDGIRIPFGSFNTFITNNNIERNAQSGLNINSEDNIIQENQIEKNKDNGLFIRSTPDFTPTGNFVYRNEFKENMPRNVQDLGVDNNYLENKFKRRKN